MEKPIFEFILETRGRLRREDWEAGSKAGLALDVSLGNAGI